MPFSGSLTTMAELIASQLPGGLAGVGTFVRKCQPPASYNANPSDVGAGQLYGGFTQSCVCTRVYATYTAPARPDHWFTSTLGLSVKSPSVATLWASGTSS